MRNQRIISQTFINPEANPGLETWNNKSNGTGNSRGSTLIYNIEDKESNNRQDGSMPSIDIKSPTPQQTRSPLGHHSRNRNIKDTNSMNIDKADGRKNSRNRHDENNMIRLP